jgi:hypothetical protein
MYEVCAAGIRQQLVRKNKGARGCFIAVVLDCVFEEGSFLHGFAVVHGCVLKWFVQAYRQESFVTCGTRLYTAVPFATCKGDYRM